jgi:hypothetical protein
VCNFLLFKQKIEVYTKNLQLPILIVDAGKSNESGGKYIVYTIRTGVGAESGRMKHIIHGQ